MLKSAMIDDRITQVRAVLAAVVDHIFAVTDDPITVQALLDQASAAMTERLLRDGFMMPGPLILTLVPDEHAVQIGFSDLGFPKVH